MKNLFTVIAISLVLIITGCESSSDSEQISGIEIVTTDINQTPLFFNFVDGEYYDCYDLYFFAETQSYKIGLNAPAGVMGLSAAGSDFAAAEMPTSGLTTDSDDSYVIGDSWMDMGSYNFSDHSIQSNGNVYFVRTASNEWIKLQIIFADPSQFQFQFAVQDNSGNWGPAETAVVAYDLTTTTYFDFTTAGPVTVQDWHLGLTMIPDYADELSSYMNMPTVISNFGADVQFAIIDDSSFIDVIDAPASGWLTDSAADRILGYNSENAVLVYHPEPPYNHKVLVEYPELIYMFQIGTDYYKVQFKEYNSGIILFEYSKIISES